VAPKRPQSLQKACSAAGRAAAVTNTVEPNCTNDVGKRRECWHHSCHVGECSRVIVGLCVINGRQKAP
jgi:hypothetical protein